MKNGKENIGIIKDFYRALSNGDPGYAGSVLAPEIEWDEPSPDELPFGGRHQGSKAVFKDVINTIHDAIRDFEFRPKKFFAVGDMVIVLGHSAGRGRVTDLKLEAPTAHLWTLRDGKAVKLQAFHDLSQWRAALGKRAEPERLAA